MKTKTPGLFTDVPEFVARKLDVFFQRVYAERGRQLEKWGVQRHPWTTETASTAHDSLAFTYRQECERKTKAGTVTWVDILLEEVFEAAAETDARRIREELVQVAAVTAAVIEQLDEVIGNG